MENLIHRLDFYLEEPLSPQSIADLYSFTDVNKRYIGIPEEIDALWIKLRYHNLQGDGFAHTTEMIRAALKNPEQIIILWAADSLIVPDEWWITDRLNAFSDTIPNPIILFTGCLPTKPIDYGTLKFTISPISYFEYESKKTWDEWAPEPRMLDDRSKKFLNMGTKDYPYRKFLLSHIIQNDLLKDGFVSYKALNNGTLSPSQYTPEQANEIITQANSIDAYLPLPHLDDSEEYTRMPRNFMSDSYLNMVTDTFYEPTVGTFISEKVFNAIRHQQMFMMMSPPHTLQYLRDDGYKTFGNYIDESYDTMENSYHRLMSLTKSFTDFVKQPIERIREIYIDCKPIIQHNAQRLEDTKFSEFVISELNRAKREKTQTK